VLGDIGLPGIDGYELARRMPADPDRAASTCWRSTATRGAEDRRRSLLAGLEDRLAQPPALDALAGVCSG
jgi:CheY-like chemotaxis protein